MIMRMFGLRPTPTCCAFAFWVNSPIVEAATSAVPPNKIFRRSRENVFLSSMTMLPLTAARSRPVRAFILHILPVEGYMIYNYVSNLYLTLVRAFTSHLGHSRPVEPAASPAMSAMPPKAEVGRAVACPPSRAECLTVGTAQVRLCPAYEVERITASTSNPANSNSPASRLDLNTRRRSAGSLMSSRRICQARCSAKVAKPIHAGQKL